MNVRKGIVLAGNRQMAIDTIRRDYGEKTTEWIIALEPYHFQGTDLPVVLGDKWWINPMVRRRDPALMDHINRFGGDDARCRLISC